MYILKSLHRLSTFANLSPTTIRNAIPFNVTTTMTRTGIAPVIVTSTICARNHGTDRSAPIKPVRTGLRRMRITVDPVRFLSNINTNCTKPEQWGIAQAFLRDNRARGNVVTVLFQAAFRHFMQPKINYNRGGNVAEVLFKRRKDNCIFRSA